LQMIRSTALGLAIPVEEVKMKAHDSTKNEPMEI